MILAASCLRLHAGTLLYERGQVRTQARIGIADSIYKTLRCRPFRPRSPWRSPTHGTSNGGTLGYYATVYYVCHGDVALGRAGTS
jgi:GPH family glycoside/pentoside/hexuronide:cation symporter